MSRNNTGIIRVQKNRENPYVMINKNFLSDDRLSFKAKGILAYLLSKPDDWKVIVGDIIKQSKDGEKAIYSGLKELKECGYLEKYPVRIDGKIAYWESIVYEVPIEPAELLPQNRQVDECIENANSELFPQNGQVENDHVENRVRNNNDFNNNDFNDVVVEDNPNEELILSIMKKINELNFKFKYTFSINDIGSVAAAYDESLEMINSALEYMILNEPKGGFKNFTGFLISAKGYKPTPKETKDEFKAPANNKAQNKSAVNPHKTKFHLGKSRGEKYTAEELEEMILANQREKIEKYKKE